MLAVVQPYQVTTTDVAASNVNVNVAVAAARRTNTSTLSSSSTTTTVLCPPRSANAILAPASLPPALQRHQTAPPAITATSAAASNPPTHAHPHLQRTSTTPPPSTQTQTQTQAPALVIGVSAPPHPDVETNAADAHSTPSESPSSSSSSPSSSSASNTTPPPPFDINAYPATDLLKLLALLLTHIATTNDALLPSSSPTSPTSPTTTGGVHGPLHQHPQHPSSLHPSADSPAIWATLTSASRSAISTPAGPLAFHARNVPTITLEAYLLRILKYCPTSNHVFLSLLVYFDRLSKLGEEAVGRAFVIDSYNIHRLVIAGVTVASKFFSDVFYTNSRYAKVGGLPLPELNQLELQFLLLNDFRLVIHSTEMQHYAEQLIRFARSPQAGGVKVYLPPVSEVGESGSAGITGSGVGGSGMGGGTQGGIGGVQGMGGVQGLGASGPGISISTNHPVISPPAPTHSSSSGSSTATIGSVAHTQAHQHSQQHQHHLGHPMHQPPHSHQHPHLHPHSHSHPQHPQPQPIQHAPPPSAFASSSSSSSVASSSSSASASLPVHPHQHSRPAPVHRPGPGQPSHSHIGQGQGQGQGYQAHTGTYNHNVNMGGVNNVNGTYGAGARGHAYSANGVPLHGHGQVYPSTYSSSGAYSGAYTNPSVQGHGYPSQYGYEAQANGAGPARPLAALGGVHTSVGGGGYARWGEAGAGVGGGVGGRGVGGSIGGSGSTNTSTSKQTPTSTPMSTDDDASSAYDSASSYADDADTSTDAGDGDSIDVDVDIDADTSTDAGTETSTDDEPTIRAGTTVAGSVWGDEDEVVGGADGGSTGRDGCEGEGEGEGGGTPAANAIGTPGVTGREGRMRSSP